MENKRHTELHQALDELCACYFSQTRKLFSQSTILELMQFSSKLMDMEQDGKIPPCFVEGKHD